MLNHDGNLMDAASIAAITALSHFRRPDVSSVGEEITVVSWHTHLALLTLATQVYFYVPDQLNDNIWQLGASKLGVVISSWSTWFSCPNKLMIYPQTVFALLLM